MRIALGPGLVLAHVLQGLWHPARKVREVRLFELCLWSLLTMASCSQVYWQIYGSLYMGAQDALVAFYPSLPDLSDERNLYEREVRLFLRL